MKVKENLKLRKIGTNYVVVPFGEKESELPDLIQLNEVGAFLWEQLQQEKSIDELIKILQNEYDVDYDTLKEDINSFIEKCNIHNLLK